MSGEGRQRSGGSLESIRDVEIAERTFGEKVVDLFHEQTIPVVGIVVVTLATLGLYWWEGWTVTTYIWLLLMADVGLIGYVLLKARTLLGGIWAMLMTTSALWLVDSEGSDFTLDLLIASFDLPGPTMATAGYIFRLDLVVYELVIPFPSMDTFFFLILTILLVVYFIVTYRNDRKLE